MTVTINEKYVAQLEKRVLEQEQLITLLNEKISSMSSSEGSGSGGASFASVAATPRSSNSRAVRRSEERTSISLIGSRKSENVQSVPALKYAQNFVSRVDPATTAEVLTRHLLSNVDGLSTVKCSKIKSRHSSYASFHLTIPAEQSHLVETADVWPEGSFMKVFSGRLLASYVTECFDTNPPAAGKPALQSKPPASKTSSSKAPSQRAVAVSSPADKQRTAGSPKPTSPKNLRSKPVLKKV